MGLRRPAVHFGGAAAVVGVMVGALLVSSLLVPIPGATHRRASSTTSGGPGMIDPEFLPQTLTSANASANGHYGGAVAVTGATVAAGAPGEPGPYSGGYFVQGLAHVTNLTTGASQWLGAFGSYNGGAFGWSVAIDHRFLVVGAPGSGYGLSGGSTTPGRVYVFNGTTRAPLYSLGSPNGVAWYSSTLARYITDDFGVSVAISGTTIVVGAPGENASGDVDAGHAYVINALTQSVLELTSPAPQPAGLFGAAVSISGTTVVVGAPGEELNAGNAYVFASGSGDLLASLVSLHPTVGGSFGTAVAVNGTVAVVGAPGEGASLSHTEPAGDAYTFDLSSHTTTVLYGDNNTSAGHFGAAVAIGGAGIVVGAPAETPHGVAAAGNAYLFSAVTGKSVHALLTAPDSPANGTFGAAVAFNGSAAFVGAPRENGSAKTGAGHVYVFSRIPLTVNSTVAPFGGYFGASVSINASFAIGAPHDGPGGVAGAGRAYYLANDLGPMQVVVPPTPQAGEAFGTSVACSPSYLVVGAPGFGSGAGAAYIFSEPSGTLLHTLVGPTSSAFGRSVALSGALVAVGAPGAFGSGEAFVYNISSSILSTVADPGAVAGSLFGLSVGIQGHYLAVGAPGPAASAGAAYLYDVSGVPALLATLGDPTGGSGNFGTSVALGGSTVVVGAPNDSASGVTDAGRAFVFVRPSGSLFASYSSPNATANGRFGAAAADDGGQVVVGAPGESPYAIPGAGSVYVFNVGTAFPVEQYVAEPPDLGGFGSAVAIGPAGRVIVGDVPTSPGGPDSAYIFTL